jgi:hypothetical protein
MRWVVVYGAMRKNIQRLIPPLIEAVADGISPQPPKCAVIVMACDQDIIPNAERIKAIIDDSDLHPRPRSSADYQRRHLLGVRRRPAWVPQPANSVEWGGGRFQSAPTEADERN